jgi:hypothetical protein
MKTSRQWLIALTAAIGCGVGMPVLGNESNDGSYQDQSVFRPALVQQSPATAGEQVPTSRWDAQEPVQTPEQDVPGIPPGACASCAPTPDFGLQFIAGIEATFFWPQLSRPFLQTGFVNDLGIVENINNAALGSADGSFMVGPRVTMGLQGECWGLVGRYWNSATWGEGFIPAFPDAAQSGILVFDTFRAYTVDLEVQRRFCWRHWDTFGFFGVRYASADNDRNLWIQNSFGDDLVQASAFAGQQYNGTGVTFGVFGLRPLFCDDGALKAYFTNRYSIIWGNGVAAVQTNASAANGIGFAESTDGALAIGDGDMFIVELGAGLHWDTCLRCLPGRAFLRAGVEWQYWDANAGVSAESFSFGDVITSEAAALARTGDLLFDLVGLTFGAGIMY